MSNYDEIKNLLKKSRTMLSNDRSLNESREILRKYNLILEAEGDVEEPNNIIKRQSNGQY